MPRSLGPICQLDPGDQHWNVIKAMERGDGQAAAEELAGDLEKAAEWVRQHVEFESD